MLKRIIQTTLWQRLANDLQLALIFIVAGLSFTFITPFTVYRIIIGDYIIAGANSLLIAVSSVFAIRALQTGKTRVPGLVISIVCMAGMLVITVSKGIEGFLWFYPLIIFAFHLTPLRFALALVAFGLAVITLVDFFIIQSIFPSTIQFFSFLATTICVIIFSYAFADRNTQQRKKLQQLAARDGLTNLKNRRSMESELDMVAAAKRDQEYGLIILDLDNLKTINDKLGHSEGDRILIDLANLIVHATRRSDEVFRYGGDEFVILVSSVNAHGLAEVCRNLLKKINQTIHYNNTAVTVSMGAALLGPTDSVSEWFQKADKCLYQAKDAGRNSYAVHENI